ncbi:FAD-dependent oxidoreductase [Shewanella yunxiaonensis]
MSLLSKLNHFWRPTVDQQACLRSKGLDCQLCTQACYEDIDLHHPEQSAPRARCTKCSECSAACPVHAISFPFSRWLKISPKTIIPTITSETSTIESVTPKALPLSPKQPTQNYVFNQALRCIQCGLCKQACPLHNEIPAWMALLRGNHLIDAVEVMHSTNSLPEICGLVCPQERLCEGACSLGKLDGPVKVGTVEHFVTTAAIAQGWKPDLSRVKPKNKRVAVIGAGPAGLACADVLIRNGIQPVVFDRYPVIGGMLSFGIPSYKLDKLILQQRQQLFSEMGIEFHLNTEVGKDISFNELLKTYDAVFVGTGTYRSKTAGLEHEDASGVIQALPYLMAVNRHTMGFSETEQQPYLNVMGKHVVVIGGGDTAMDCVRTALRKNAASVTCLYRRDEASMPASVKEVALAKQEGAQFRFNVQPVELQLDNSLQVTGVIVQSTKLGALDACGRKAPVVIAGPKRVIAAERVILALGFEAQHMPWLDEIGVELDNNGYIVTQQSTENALQTSLVKVYAGGDIVHGSDLVVTAIADGRRAAMSMITAMEQ